MSQRVRRQKVPARRGLLITLTVLAVAKAIPLASGLVWLLFSSVQWVAGEIAYHAVLGFLPWAVAALWLAIGLHRFGLNIRLAQALTLGVAALLCFGLPARINHVVDSRARALTAEDIRLDAAPFALGTVAILDSGRNYCDSDCFRLLISGAAQAVLFANNGLGRKRELTPRDLSRTATAYLFVRDDRCEDPGTARRTGYVTQDLKKLEPHGYCLVTEERRLGDADTVVQKSHGSATTWGPRSDRLSVWRNTSGHLTLLMRQTRAVYDRRYFVWLREPRTYQMFLSLSFDLIPIEGETMTYGAAAIPKIPEVLAMLSAKPVDAIPPDLRAILRPND